MVLIATRAASAAPADAPLPEASDEKPAATIPSGGPMIRARKESASTLVSAQDRRYRILLSIPDGEPPAHGFPVLYVLDADAWFDAAVAIVRMREYQKLDPAVVVGVASPGGAFFEVSRTYDFTPRGSADARMGELRTGGADEFRAFLTGKLKPWVRDRARVDDKREILFGHSLGGLFALDAVLKAPASFDVYLAASPSVGFSDRAIVEAAAACNKRSGKPAPHVLVTDGGLESRPSPALVEDYRRHFTAHPEEIGGRPVEEALAEVFADNPKFDKIAATRALTARLVECGIAATFAEFPDEEHMSAAISALNRGIPFALRAR